MTRSTPPNPHRFVLHLPAGARAATLEEALDVLTRRYGPAAEEQCGEGLVALGFEGEDKRIRVFKDAGSGSPIAILTQPTAAIQLFIRPCSGWTGRATATGSATGNVLSVPALTAVAHGSALVNYARLIAATPNLCAAPCVMIPVGPYPSGINVTVVRRVLGIPFRVTVTVDESAELVCV